MNPWVLRYICYLQSLREIKALHAELFFMLRLSAAAFYSKLSFKKNRSGTLSECQTVWIQIRTDILSVLIWVQTVCKQYQLTTKFAASKERVNLSIRVRTGLKSTWIYRTVLKSPWKLNLPWKVLVKHSVALKSPWILPFTGGFNTVFWDPYQYKLVCLYLKSTWKTLNGLEKSLNFTIYRRI